MAVDLGLDPTPILDAHGDELTTWHAVLIRAQEMRDERRLAEDKRLAALIAERVGKLFG